MSARGMLLVVLPLLGALVGGCPKQVTPPN